MKKLPKLLTIITFISTTGSLFSGGILERYRGSVQEKMLDEQIKNYRAYAKKNAQTFGKAYMNDPNYNRHVGLEKLRKVMPNSQTRDRIPEYRLKAGLKPPAPQLNPYFNKPPRR
jgi:hypothetical protein